LTFLKCQKFAGLNLLSAIVHRYFPVPNVDLNCILKCDNAFLNCRKIRSLIFDKCKFNDSVAGQSATIRFGRGRRPRGPTYARGTIRSLFEDQEQATQRTAYDVATRPPCRNLFWGRSFRNNSVCLCRQSIHFEFIGSGFIFVYRITFSFISVSLSVSLSVFVCFFRGFFRVFIVESLCQPVLGRLESHMLAPKF
jgi:hypothetical protein